MTRRFAYAQLAAKDGDWRAAADVLEQTLELAPDWAPAWFALGEVREKLANLDEAAAAFRSALQHDPEDHQGARPRLALLSGQAATSLPSAYVARLFDDYAARFDSHLTNELAYRGPEVIVQALDEVATGRRFYRAFDLGCGTGLAGVALRARVDALDGVDLSAEMVAKAKSRNIYDELETGEVVTFLLGRDPAVADLIFAADVLVYFGVLEELFWACARSSRRGGLFAFTGEKFEGPGFRLGSNMRFAHSYDYIRAMADSNGYRELCFQDVSTRREAGRDVLGFVAVFQYAR